MTDLAALATGSHSMRKGPLCSIAQALGELPPEQAENLRAALANPNAPAMAISRALVGLGFSIKTRTIYRHRGGECACPTA